MKSPCVNICIIDEESGLCTGCWRTLDEIAGWGAFKPDERNRIMAALEGRKKAHPHG